MKIRHALWTFIGLASIVLWGAAAAGEAPEMSGAELYATFCSSCHGESARGDGPIAPALKVPVPDLTLFAARRGGVFSPKEMQRIIDGRFAIKSHGSREMPVWGNEFYGYAGKDPFRRQMVNRRIADLVAYLGFIQSVRID